MCFWYGIFKGMSLGNGVALYYCNDVCYLNIRALQILHKCVTGH